MEKCALLIVCFLVIYNNLQYIKIKAQVHLERTELGLNSAILCKSASFITSRQCSWDKQPCHDCNNLKFLRFPDFSLTKVKNFPDQELK